MKIIVDFDEKKYNILKTDEHWYNHISTIELQEAIANSTLLEKDNKIALIKQKYNNRRTKVKQDYAKYHKMDDYDIGVCQGLTMALEILREGDNKDEQAMIYICKYYPNMIKKVKATSFEDACTKIYPVKFYEVYDKDSTYWDVAVTKGKKTKYFAAICG